MDTLTLRRAFPRPVTYADLKAAYPVLRARYGVFLSTANSHVAHILGQGLIREYWHAALKDVTGAVDEIVDCTGAQVAIIEGPNGGAASASARPCDLATLLDAADAANYWQGPTSITIAVGKPAATHEDHP